MKDFVIKILMTYDKFAYKLGDKLFDIGRFVKRVYLSKKPPQLVLAVQVVKYVIMLVLFFTVIASLASLLPIPGNFKSLVVMSGSMEPTIHVGSVAIVKPTEDIKTGDIITFKNPSDPKNLITHRIVEEKEGIFKTKGDANNASDNWEISKSDIVGKLRFSIPYLGYAVHSTKTPKGFIFLIIFPAILIILDELRTIKNELEKKYALKYAKNAKEKRKTKNAKLVVSLILLFGVTVLALGATHAYFSDTAKSEDNVFSAGTWGNLVINEIMQNPSKVDDAEGEWFELYNPSSTAVDINGWIIKDNNSDSHTINNGGPLTIPAGGYLVLCRNGNLAVNGGVSCNYDYSGFILGNDNDEIVLLNGIVEEDRVEYDGGPNFPDPDGKSIELKNSSLNNNIGSNWEEASEKYNGVDYGTPGLTN